MVDHKIHRNTLYTLVILLAALQLVSFLVLSAQVSRLTVNLENEIQQSRDELRQERNLMFEDYNTVYQNNFNEIVRMLSNQQDSLEEQISNLKSIQDDFSGVVDDSVKSVVTVSTKRSMGTGFFVNSSGYIITNYHVIEGEEEVTVIPHDRQFIEARLVGKDERRDLALLKIERSYPALELADSDDLQVGKRVVAIGNPLGLSFTVTEGIISALDRRGPSGLEEYVQTDVSLNPGNSGGPLIDSTGRVVGINNFKIGGAESLGFSLESDAIRESIEEMTNQTIVQ